MDKDQAQQVAAYRAKQVRKDAVDRLQNSVSQLQRSAFELGLYAERLEKAENDAQRSLLVNWARCLAPRPHRQGYIEAFNHPDSSPAP